MARPLNACRDCGKTWYPKGQDGYLGKQFVAPGLAADLSSASVVGTLRRKIQPAESESKAPRVDSISIDSLRQQHPTAIGARG